MDAMIEVKDLSWRTNGATIVERVSFQVAPGELVALMGRNGAGKSTVMDLVAGLRQPSTGSIALEGRPLGDWSAAERARRIGHLPQAVRAELPFTADQVVMMGRYPHAGGWSESPADRDASERAMAACECLQFTGRRLSTLSGGERQRVLLAACLAQEPRLLLLDEPAAFLDVDQQLQCFSLLRDQAAAGLACVAVTHDVNLALAFCSRLIVLAGKTVARDMPVATAIDRPDWLALFSSRLQQTREADGRSWVSYR
jgi:iron complex transport system ATP-binding protein